MPNEVKPTTTPASSPSVQPRPVGVPNTVPGRVEPKNDASNAGAKKTRDDDKPLEIEVEQKTS